MNVIDIKLSKKQKLAMDMIKELEHQFGVRWFIQAELPGITLHTMDALISKNLLETKEFNNLTYYKWTGL